VTMDRRLIIAATALLDSGGDGAVTLRTVGHASGIPHNAPYKHFKSRMRDRQAQHGIYFEVPQ
jgi:AcrR family transcriptional regulator